LAEKTAFVYISPRNPRAAMPSLQCTPMRQRSFTTSADIPATPSVLPHSREATGSPIPNSQPSSLETSAPPPGQKPKEGSDGSGPESEVALQYLKAASASWESVIAYINSALILIGTSQTVSARGKVNSIRQDLHWALDEAREGKIKTDNARTLTEAINEQKEQALPSITAENSLQALEDRLLSRLAQLEAKMDNLPPKSWAQVAAPPTRQGEGSPTTTRRSLKTSEEATKMKEARARYEFTLTAKGATAEVQVQLKEHTAVEITKRIQWAIDNALPDQKIKINGIKKLGSNVIKIQCKDPEQAKMMRTCSIDWGKAYAGLQSYKVKHGVVVHGIPTGAIDFSNWGEAAREIEEDNAHRIKITEIGPLRRRGKPGQAAHQSIVIHTNSPTEADACIKFGIIIASEHHDAEKYCPHLQITQCFKCHRYDGHKAANCTHHEKCGRCGAEGHNTTVCEASQPCCPDCQEPHPAWHAECKVREANKRHLAERRESETPYFSL
jgi:hypothetical protein